MPDQSGFRLPMVWGVVDRLAMIPRRCRSGGRRARAARLRSCWKRLKRRWPGAGTCDAERRWERCWESKPFQRIRANQDWIVFPIFEHLSHSYGLLILVLCQAPVKTDSFFILAASKPVCRAFSKGDEADAIARLKECHRQKTCLLRARKARLCRAEGPCQRCLWGGGGWVGGYR